MRMGLSSYKEIPDFMSKPVIIKDDKEISRLNNIFKSQDNKKIKKEIERINLIKGKFGLSVEEFLLSRTLEPII